MFKFILVIVFFTGPSGDIDIKAVEYLDKNKCYAASQSLVQRPEVPKVACFKINALLKTYEEISNEP